MNAWGIVKLLIEVVLLFLRNRYDPERLKREVSERIDRGFEKKQQAFRKAVADRDEDAVSDRLGRVADRLRNDRAEGEVPPGE